MASLLPRGVNSALDGVGPRVIIERLGEATPPLEEMLDVLGARIEDGKLVIPMRALRHTEDGIEVNVLAHYCRFHDGEWKGIRRVNAPDANPTTRGAVSRVK